jgi:hypothetical protein
MAQLWLSGLIIGANAGQDFFQDNVDPHKLRVFDAVPINPNVPFNAQAEITEVFHLLKGNGDGDLQVNVTVKNLVGGPWGPDTGGSFLAFQVWIAEV